MACTVQDQDASVCKGSALVVTPSRKVCLIVIDGWGISSEKHGNAILNAKTPVMDKLMGNSIPIEASEVHVGLPDGQMGNSEVGHLNIGAGRIVWQDIVRINMAVNNNTLISNPVMVEACTRAKSVSRGRIHLIGLVSDGGVHSHKDHMLGLVRTFKDNGVKDCYLHFIADGRDTSPTSGVGFLSETLEQFESTQYGTLATVIGRYYAMDRDKNWERTKVAFDAMVSGDGTPCKNEEIVAKVQESYALGNKHTDEFLKPYILGGESARIQENDTIVFFNYRSDRMRQIVTAFGIETKFDSKLPSNLSVYCMTQYDPTFTFPMLFPPISMENVLAEWLSVCKVRQLHLAETEKYAHVTFFFNGGVENQFENEDRVLVPSPKVATYDLKPEMSCHEVAEKTIEGIRSGNYPFIMLNFAPPDMVGHTGCYEPTVRACEATDAEIGRILNACEENNYVLMVTADHGNAEKMLDDHDKPFTAHTLFPVPLTINQGLKLQCPSNRKPALCDVAPTVLDVMGLPIPSQMTGQSLLVK